MNVKRYDPGMTYDPQPEGEYVQHSDYAALSADLTALREAVKAWAKWTNQFEELKGVLRKTKWSADDPSFMELIDSRDDAEGEVYEAEQALLRLANATTTGGSDE